MTSHNNDLISSIFLSAVVTSLSEKHHSNQKTPTTTRTINESTSSATVKKSTSESSHKTDNSELDSKWVTVVSKKKSSKNDYSTSSASVSQLKSQLPLDKPHEATTKNSFSLLASIDKVKHQGNNYVAGKPKSTKCSRKNQRRNARRRAAAEKRRRAKILKVDPMEDNCVSPTNSREQDHLIEQEVEKRCLLLDLPYNVLTGNILSYLRPEEMSTLGACSKYTKMVTEEGYLWQSMFRQRFPYSQLSPKSMKEWKLAFKLTLSKILDRLRCFSTKKTFFEDVLGAGVSFSVNPKTRTVDYVDLSQDLISKTAFDKNKIRSDVFGNTFELFLPLYFTEHHFQRALPTICKSISRLMVGKGGNKGRCSFENMVLDVMPKIVNTIAVLLSDQGKSASYKCFLCLSRVHRLFLALAHQYPTIKRLALIRLQAFASSSKNRNKTICPSLGSILPLLMIIDEKDFGWNHLRVAYVTENMDRGVLWSCKKYPQLELTHDASGAVENTEMAEKRVALTFDAMAVSLRLCMFHVYFYKATCIGMTTQERANRYDRFFGQPDPDQSSSDTLSFGHFRNQVNFILSVKTWHEFFGIVGLQCPPTKAEMARKLRQHVKNSLQKKYHRQKMNFSLIHASGTSKILSKGQQYSASSDLSRVVFADVWKFQGDQKYLDATCLVYKGKQLVHTVDYRHQNAEEGAIQHSGDVMEQGRGTHTIHINLEQLSPTISSCVFVISAWADATLADILSPSIAFRNADSENDAPLCTYDLDAQHKISYLTSVIMCKLYRTTDGKWHVQAIGDAHKGAADNYGPIYQAVEKLL